MDGLISSRAITHAVAEQTMYGDLSGKPCLIEEIGTLGNIYGDKDTVADFLRANLWNAWANNGHGLTWWTAFDQNFGYPPYEWCDCERELGVCTQAREPKPIEKEKPQYTFYGASIRRKSLFDCGNQQYDGRYC